MGNKADKMFFILSGEKKINSYEVGYLKPQAEIYQIALEKMNVNPEKSIFIGDGGSDELSGAKKSGIKTILTGYLLKRDKKQYDEIEKFADYYIEDFKEIKNILFSEKSSVFKNIKN